MVDTTELEKRIDQLGLKKSFVAEELGISIQALRRKLNQEADFWTEEAKTLKELLDLNDDEAQKIFFKK